MSSVTINNEEEGLSLHSSVAQIALTLHSFTEPAPLFEHALDAILAVTRANAGSLFIWDEEAKELVFKAGRGPSVDKLGRVRVKLREGIAGQVAQKGTSVLVRDIRKDQRFQEFARQGNYNSESFMSLPLLAGNKLVGVLNITERASRQPFTDADLKATEVLARHLAIAHENLKIQRKFRRENAELTETVEALKQELTQQQPLVALGKLASNLAHELNNPLDAIRRFVNLALDQVMEDSLAREYLLKAKQGIRRAIQVIRGLLAFSREYKTTRRSVELHYLIDRSAAIIGQEPTFEGIDIVKKYDKGSVFVVDFGLQTVFQNLLQNAQHAMNAAGKIEISTSFQTGRAVITVEDTGPGIPEEIRSRIFEPFFTTKEKGAGTGIGLAICRDIIERSGGQITFECPQTGGTRFIITLPCEEQNREI